MENDTGLAEISTAEQSLQLTIIDPGAQEWYGLLVDDCKAIITEAVFTSRWSLVEGYHQLGKRIVTDSNLKQHAKGNESFLTDLSRNSGIHVRNLYRAVQFYNAYPELDKVPEGKNISWNKIVTKYLPQPEPGGRFLTPHQQAKELAMALICGAIDDHDKAWLLSDDCRDYFEELELPYDFVYYWASLGFIGVEDLIKRILHKRMEETTSIDRPGFTDLDKIRVLRVALKTLADCSPCQNGCNPDDMTCASNLARVALEKTNAYKRHGR